MNHPGGHQLWDGEMGCWHHGCQHALPSRPPLRTLYALQKLGPRDPQISHARDPAHTNSTTLAAARSPESATPNTHDITKVRNRTTPHGRISSHPNKSGRENGAGQTLKGPRTTTRCDRGCAYSSGDRPRQHLGHGRRKRRAAGTAAHRPTHLPP